MQYEVILVRNAQIPVVTPEKVYYEEKQACIFIKECNEYTLNMNNQMFEFVDRAEPTKVKAAIARSEVLGIIHHP